VSNTSHTLAHAVQVAQAQGVARLDAQLLLLHALGRPSSDRAWLIAHGQDAWPSSLLSSDWAHLVQRRAQGEPLAYIVGHKEFFGLRLQVDKRVLDPRDDTETLVDWGLQLLQALPATTHAQVLDLGTGSGAVALAVKHGWPGACVCATDISADALVVAGTNAQILQLPVHLAQGAWLDAVAGQLPVSRFDLIVSNPPYVAEGDPHLIHLHEEPLQALVAGADGLRDVRHIVQQAPAFLQPGGWLLLEHGWNQAQAVRQLLASAGLTQVQSRTDLAGIERCSGGQWPLVK
jgi:release factor glutamine methyltransferase